MAPPKDIARSYPKRGITADVGFRSEPKFCGDGSVKLDGSTQGATSATSYSVATSGAKTTLACWVNPRDLSGSNRTMVGNCVNNATDNMALYQTGTNEMDAIILYGSGLSFKFAAKNLDENRWYFVAATFDYDATTFKFYVDGVEFSDTPSLGYGGTAGLFEIGFRDDSGGDIQHVNANLAHVMMIEDVLTQGEIVELMRDTSYAKAQTFGTVNRYYELDADFNDDTGSHNATSVGSPSFTVDRPQLPRGLDLARGAAMARVYTGRAVDFDGSADRITAAHYNPGGDYLTTTAWVNADTLRFQGLIHNGNTGRNSFLFYMLSSGAIQFYWNDTTGDARITHQTLLGAGQWHHLAMVLDMSDPADHQATCYIDGIAATASRASGSWVGDNTYQFGNQFGTSGWFDGKIADCRIYDVALTQTQVRELYHNPEQVLPTGVSASNLRRYYPLSDYNDTGGTGGRYFQDMGADGEPAEDQGSASMAFAQPVPCPQLGLQQSASRIYWDDNTAEKLSATIPALGTDFTIALWWFNENSPTSDVFLEVNTPGAYQFYYDGTQIVYYSSTAGTFYTGVSLPVGEWSHIGFTQNGVYKNGVLYTTTFSPDWLGTAYRMFGRHSASNACAGVSSNMAFWSDALTTAEMLELYNQGPDYDPRNDTGNYASSDTLQNLWFMDDLTTVKDRKGSNDLTVIGSPIMQSFPENASGSTIVGDFTLKRRGVSVLNKTEDDNDVLAIIPASADVFPTSQGFTCSVWVRGRKTTGNAYIVATTNRTTSQRYSIYTQSAANNWGLEMPVSASPTTADAAITYDPNEWACLSFTLDFGTNTVKMYTNGALQTTVTRSLVVPTTFSDINVGGSGAAHGSITGTTPVALFKVAQRTWSDDEVERNYYSDLRLIKGLNNE